MTLVKKFSATIVTGLLAFSAVGGLSTDAFAADIHSDTVNEQQSNIKVETQVIDGQEYTLQWDTEDDSIEILDSNGELLGSTTMAEAKAQYAKATAEVPKTAAGANSCSVTLGAVGIANSALWAAAGLTAVAPPAAAVAAGAGVVTGAIIGVGGMFC